MNTFVVVPIFDGDSLDLMPESFIFDVPYDGDYSFVISGSTLSVVLSGNTTSPTKKVEALIVAEHEEIPPGYTLQFAFEFDSEDKDSTTDDVAWFAICTKEHKTVVYEWKNQF
jgi:hypothetical protein